MQLVLSWEAGKTKCPLKFFFKRDGVISEDDIQLFGKADYLQNTLIIMDYYE